MTWLLSFVAIYFAIGLVVAFIRISIHDMPWQLFVFTAIFWPVLWIG